MYKAQITRLQATVDNGLQEVGRLQAVNDDLRLRLAGLYLSWRALGEVCAHLNACAPIGEDSSSSSGSGRDAAALRAQLALEGCIAEALGGHGTGDGGSCVREPATFLEEAARLAAPLLDHLPHLAPGRSILHLEGVTAEEVEGYKTMELPAFHERWRALITEARDAIARVDAFEAAEGIWAAESATRRTELRAALWDVGVRMTRVHHLLVLHATPLFMRFCSSHMETGQSVMGDADAPLSHYEGVVRASKYSRIQARLAVSLSSSFRTRLGALHAERAAICEQLAVANRQPVAAPAGTGLPVTADEVAISLEENTRAEGSMHAAAAHTLVAVLTPAQSARTAIATFPYPVPGPKFFPVVSHMLRFEPSAFEEEAE